MAGNQAVEAAPVVAVMRLPKGLIIGLTGSALSMALSVGGYFEGRTNTAYQDMGGVWTICDGHTDGVYAGQIATKAECDAFQAADTLKAQRVVERLVTVPLPPSRKAALTDFVVNLGGETLRKSSVLRKLNAGDVAGGCAAISLYHYVGKADCNLDSRCSGIVTRRNVERWLCELE